MSSLFTKDIAVLDVSSKQITGIIGLKKSSLINIKASVQKDFSGFEDGVWFDTKETLQTAKAVLKELKQKSNTKTKRLFISVPCEFLAVVSKEVEINLDRERKIIDADIDYLLKKGDSFDSNRYVTINTSAIYYSIDKSEELFVDVRGLSARKVSGFVSYILCESSFVTMFDALATSVGFKEVQYIASNWAESLALFEKEQRDLPFVLLDIGYLTSSVTLARGEGVLDMKSFSMGSGHMAGDIFEALDVPFNLAEDARDLVDLNLNYDENTILVSDSEHTIYASDACEIVKSRLDVFAEIIGEIIYAFENDAPTIMPLYLTGDGIASIRGAKKYLSELLGRNIEIISPKLAGFTKPCHSSKIALLTVAETLSFGLGDYFKQVLIGGKKW